MALSAPIPIIEGSQTEFSKVWIRGSAATAALPNLRFYKADGRIVHPIAAALDITIVHTAADTLYNRIQAAITAADATKTAAWVAKWFGKHQIVGVTSDAITGDTLLVNRAETTGITASNDEPTARAAADFFAQETYATGTRFRHGILPGDQAGLNGATVNVSGEVETAQASKVTSVTGTIVDGTPLQMSCLGLNTATAEFRTTSGSPSVRCQVSNNGTDWVYTRGFTSTTTGTQVSIVTSFAVSANYKMVFDVAGFAYCRVIMVPGAGSVVTMLSASGASYEGPSPIINSSGAATVAISSGPSTYNSTISSSLLGQALEVRTTEPTLVAEGSAQRQVATPAGHSMTWAGSVPGADRWCYSTKTTPLTGDGSTTIAAAVSGKRHFVEHLSVMNKGTGNADVSIEDADGVPVWGPFNLDGDGAVAGMCPSFLSPMDAMDGTTRGAVNKALVIKVANTSGTVSIQATVRGFKSSMGV